MPKLGPKKKWAVSPLLSPPAGKVTANLADKFVCMYRIRPNCGKFNGNAEISRVWRGLGDDVGAAATDLGNGGGEGNTEAGWIAGLQDGFKPVDGRA